MIEQVAERETETASVAWEPALIGEVTLLRRTLAAAVDGSTNAVSASVTRTNRRIVSAYPIGSLTSSPWQTPCRNAIPDKG